MTDLRRVRRRLRRPGRQWTDLRARHPGTTARRCWPRPSACCVPAAVGPRHPQPGPDRARAAGTRVEFINPDHKVEYHHHEMVDPFHATVSSMSSPTAFHSCLGPWPRENSRRRNSSFIPASTENRWRATCWPTSRIALDRQDSAPDGSPDHGRALRQRPCRSRPSRRHSSLASATDIREPGVTSGNRRADRGAAVHPLDRGDAPSNDLSPQALGVVLHPRGLRSS